MSTQPYPVFSARRPWLGPDLQTLRNRLRGPALARPSDERARSLQFPLDDDTGDQMTGRLFTPPSAVLRQNAPLVVLVHGLGGSEDSDYMQVSAAYLLSRGYAVLRLSLRGAGPSRTLCRDQYHAGRTADFHSVVRQLSLRDSPAADYAQEGIVAVGYSLGGNMLLKYAAEYGGLRGAVSVSAPIDLSAASHRFLDARNRFYHLYLLRSIKQEALAATSGLSDAERECIPQLGSILEFDHHFVAPRHGFHDADHYYAENSAVRFLPEIQLPTLVIHACDDPWIPAATYLEFPWSENRHLEPLLPPSGGHVGFHSAGSRVPWHDQCLEHFLDRI